MLLESDVNTVWVAKLAETDVEENSAAAGIAQALGQTAGLRVGAASTGRCNVYATESGICTFDSDAVHNLNALTENVTIATVAPMVRVRKGQLVATVKIIPFALDKIISEQATQLAASVGMQVHGFRRSTASLILTEVGGMKPSLFDKAETVTRSRLATVNMDLHAVSKVKHDIQLLASAIIEAKSDLILILGGSAISDRADIIPAAIEMAGGTVTRLGMPVDPGNLLCLAAHKDGRTILGLPGCARSPKLNGLDWVLERLAAGLTVTSADIARMGVGGLLDELPERGSLRTVADAPVATSQALKTGALVLAAGRSSRMNGPNKLLLDDGHGPVIKQVVTLLHAADITDVIAVTGRDADSISAALYPTETIYNPDFLDGLSTSIRKGLAALPASWDAALIVLGDMPAVLPSTIRQICDAARSDFDAVVPIYDGRQGHPVLWKRSVFSVLEQAQGDVGGKAQLAALADRVLKLPVDDPGVLVDIDTPDSWQDYQQAR